MGLPWRAAAQAARAAMAWAPLLRCPADASAVLALASEGAFGRRLLPADAGEVPLAEAGLGRVQSRPLGQTGSLAGLGRRNHSAWFPQIFNPRSRLTDSSAILPAEPACQSPWVASPSEHPGDSRRTSRMTNLVGTTSTMTSSISLRHGVKSSSGFSGFGGRRRMSTSTGPTPPQALSDGSGLPKPPLLPSSLFAALHRVRLVRSILRFPGRLRELRPFSRTAQELRTALQRRQETAAMQLQAFWRSNSLLLTAVGGALSVLLLDRACVSLTGLFVASPLSLHAHANCLALSAAAVLGTGLFLHSRTAISPDAVCQLALSRLNSHPGTLELLGAPVTQGLALRHAGFVAASAVAGGGVAFRGGAKGSPVGLEIDFPPRSCISVFGARGPDGAGLVNAVVTKHKGRYTLDLLALDVQVPTPAAAKNGSFTSSSTRRAGSSNSHTVTDSSSNNSSDSICSTKIEQQRIYVVGSSEDLSSFEPLLSSLHGAFNAAVNRYRKPTNSTP